MSRKNCAGFTLLELMITLAILAIIASIAYPAYIGYTQVANRSEGKVALNQIAMAQERFFGKNNAYTNNITALSGFTANPFITEHGYYSVTAGPGPTGGIATSFTITATAQGGQSGDGCTTLTLNSVGIKGGTPSKPACWTE
jgi:type IV pilus assembly protein PilE